MPVPLIVAAATFAAILAGAGVLHLLPRLGHVGRAASDRLCAGLPLDLVVTYFLALPPIAGAIVAGWPGVVAAVVAQVLGLVAWELLHEARHARTRGRAQILRANNAVVGGRFGAIRNVTACFWTAWAVPIFWCIRVAQYAVYPPLIWLVDFPKYDAREWINVSRHKFEGLVGHDRIWCLYCDWMTGVWSLGTEMLRNVESFWCPVRYSNTAKCSNCVREFPDIDGGWVDAGGDVRDAALVVRDKYGGDGPNAWFGHDSRRVPLRVNGRDVHRSNGNPVTAGR